MFSIVTPTFNRFMDAIRAFEGSVFVDAISQTRLRMTTQAKASELLFTLSNSGGSECFTVDLNIAAGNMKAAIAKVRSNIRLW